MFLNSSTKGMLYNQFVQMHSNPAAAADAVSAALQNQTTTTASPPKGSPGSGSGETTGEQPLDLSAKPMGPFGHQDAKMAFR